MNQDVEPVVDQVLGDVLELEPAEIEPDLSPDSTARWDSVRQILIVLALEDRFKVRFEPAELERVDGRQDLIAILQSKLAG